MKQHLTVGRIQFGLSSMCCTFDHQEYEPHDQTGKIVLLSGESQSRTRASPMNEDAFFETLKLLFI